MARYTDSTGRPVISVTEVLTRAGRIDTTGFSPEAAERGTRIHALTEAFDYGESPDVPSALVGYLDAWWAFTATVRPVYAPDGIERRVVSDALRLGGRIDRVCLDLFGGPALLDIKAGSPKPWHGEQLAFYNRLCPTGPRYAVYLMDDGRWKVQQYTDPLDDRRAMEDLAMVLAEHTESLR